MAINAEIITNLSPVKKLGLVVLVVALIVGGYWYSFYRSKAKTIGRLQGDLSNKQAKLNENEAIARNLPRFKEEVEKLNLQLVFGDVLECAEGTHIFGGHILLCMGEKNTY